MSTFEEIFDGFVMKGDVLDVAMFLDWHGDALDINESDAFMRAVTNRSHAIVALIFCKYSYTLRYPEERSVEVFEVLKESMKLMRSNEGAHILIRSLYHGLELIPELLVKHGANVNARLDREMPLLAAIIVGQIQNVRLLLDNGAQMYCVSPEETAFDAAIVYKKYDVLVELIKRGGDINKQNRRGRTPLMVAAEERQYSMVVLLLANGADVNIRCDDFTTALIAGGDKNIMRLLVDAGAEFRNSEFGDTALISACRSHLWKGQETLEIVRNLFDLGFTGINDEDRFGSTALMFASWTDPELVQLLLEKGADVCYMCGWGGSALHYAFRRSGTSFIARKTIFEKLLDHGADIHGRDPDGNTPLLLASRNFPDASTVKLLLSRGACTNDRNHKGHFPLLFAVFKPEGEMVSVLLEHGANMFSRTNRGITSLNRAGSDFAFSNGAKEQLVSHESNVLPWDLFSLST
eukprot:CAMPEP_0184698516 /NCGR_PEP_ID=MMETSP0313-20130426/5121_1 /TAXON_ID=2792 /ORGANISM="Porphyridium aerugineum, Strain SAG 1380-2" /LENGTH=463 /DNA_ID=CAMNT_0027157479 /DNA_START=114 /DNA_END=1505 /DNA_ORIENTATION=-